ncbi:MAG: 2OG-Fe dioxygenase family protein [Novosphingobium sp.]
MLPLRWQAGNARAHQFRIEALPGRPGLPTPEGTHHDGRDWVLILLVGGGNYAGGESRVEDSSGTCILKHRLTRPSEALLLNDRVVRHGTTPIEAAISGTPAWRDTLVLTFAQARES